MASVMICALKRTSVTQSSALKRLVLPCAFLHNRATKQENIVAKHKKGEVPFDGEDLEDPTGEQKAHVLRSYEPEEIRRWIKVLCRMSGLWPTELARNAGVAPSTVNRFVYNEDAKHRPSSRTLQKLDYAAAVGFGDRVGVTYEQPGATYDEHEYAEYPDEPLEEGQSAKGKYHSTVVVGRVQAGDWQEAFEWDEDDRYPVPGIATQEMLLEPKFALEVWGDSMDLVYPADSVLVCVPLRFVDRNPVPGERVIVVRRDKNGLVEATVKEFQMDASGQAWLWPRSSNPEHQLPIAFQHDEIDEEDQVVITALVTGSLQPEPRPPDLIR